MRYYPLAYLFLAFFLIPASASGQKLKNSESLDLSGVVFMDYSYTVDGPDGVAGDNGFGYRRLYLTSVYHLSENVRVRARMEARQGSTNQDGKPSPIVKDLFVRWDNLLGQGHRLVAGLSPPPSFGVSEKFFGYRSLEKTIQDRNKIVSSRDMGLAVRGPLSKEGTVRYAVMIGNNSTKQETNRHKRVYGQIEAHPSEHLSVTVGADYASLPGGSAVNTNAFIGLDMGKARMGIEGHHNSIRPEDPTEDSKRSGVSAFGAVAVRDHLEVLARFDSFSREIDGDSTVGQYGLFGVAWSPSANIQVIPNLILDKSLGADDAVITARITVRAEL